MLSRAVRSSSIWKRRLSRPEPSSTPSCSARSPAPMCSRSIAGISSRPSRCRANRSMRTCAGLNLDLPRRAETRRLQHRLRKMRRPMPWPEFPVETRYTIENGFRRCQDYQNRSYAEGYIAKLRELTALDRSIEGATRGWKLTIEGARYLALRMTYEDVIRVADLKTRRDRFASVRNDAKAKADEPILITEYLNQGPEESCALLPPRLGNSFLDWLRRRRLEHQFNIGLYVKSHTISGFLMLRALARMRFLRLKSWRYAEEFALTSRWFDAVTSAARVDYRFGVEVAEW